MSLMNFDELVPGATVRFTVIGGVQYLSTRDLIMVVCNKNINDAGEVWRNLSDERKRELQEYVIAFKFPGRGQQEQPVIMFQGAMKLIMWLPGDNAKNARTKAAEILTRYFAYGKTLFDGIEADSASDSFLKELLASRLEASERDKLRFPKVSYVYAVHSASFPGVFKIGMTQNIKSRLSNLNCSMAVHPFLLVCRFVSMNPSRDEAEAHSFFAEYKLKREHFTVPVWKLNEYFQQKQLLNVDEYIKTKAEVRLRRLFVSWKTSSIDKVKLKEHQDKPEKTLKNEANVGIQSIATKTLEVEFEKQILKKLKLKNISKFVGLMDSIRPTWRDDQPLVHKTENMLVEAMFDEPVVVTDDEQCVD